MAEQIAHHMNRAALPTAPHKRSLNCSLQTSVRVAGDHLHSTQSAIHESAQENLPARVIFARRYHHIEDSSRPLCIYSHRNKHGVRDDATSWLPNRSVVPADAPLTVVLDLGATRTIDTVQLLWTRQKNDWEGYGKAYTIAVANTSSEPVAGSSDWRTVATVSAGNGGRDSLPIIATSARYVRLSISESAGHDAANWRWPALYTFTVSGNDAPTVVGVTSGVQYLSDRLWSGESIYAGENGIDNICEKYQLGGHIQLDGVVYQKGIGLCYNMTLQYALDGTQTEFVADVGIDARESDSDTRQVIFEVIADSTTVYKSPTMTAASSKQHIAVDITGAKLLTIKYYSVDGGYPPFGNWGNAYFR